MNFIPIQRALISVSKKEGLVEFASVLRQFSVEILSTGNTAKILETAGISVVRVSDFTGFPEILGGRVKTLHPKIHGGLLARRQDFDHREQMEEHQILPIDLVVVNLYPFEETIKNREASLSEIIENIDIGGPSMLRSAAKNFESVAVVVDPNDYSSVIQLLQKNRGELDAKTRFSLSKKAFAHTALYDSAIAQFLSSISECSLDEVPTRSLFPGIWSVQGQKVSDLRYGENPHQKAAFYRMTNVEEACVAHAEVLHGKELSFNNLLDLDAACELSKEFTEPVCVIVKHNNPCGVALASDLTQAFLQAQACDPSSAFGGILAVNRPVDLSFVLEFEKSFFEALVAPDYEEVALEKLKQKKNLRILKLPKIKDAIKYESFDFKHITGGVLVQQQDCLLPSISNCKVVTELAPVDEQLRSFDFAWKVVKHVHSNAIVFVKGTRTIGIGAGQMSRIDSVKVAAMKSQETVKGAIMASDAFFPFRDGIDEAAKHGVAAIIQPGGSVRDEEAIAAANEHRMCMIFTGLRHFRH